MELSPSLAFRDVMATSCGRCAHTVSVILPSRKLYFDVLKNNNNNIPPKMYLKTSNGNLITLMFPFLFSLKIVAVFMFLTPSLTHSRSPFTFHFLRTENNPLSDLQAIVRHFALITYHVSYLNLGQTHTKER